MDEEMEDGVEYTYTVFEIDLDYEFDAARIFDLAREETITELREAERWFESADSYPPSPFVMKLSQGEKNTLLENINISPKPKNAEAENVTVFKSDSDMDLGRDSLDVDDCIGDSAIRKGCVSMSSRAVNTQKFLQAPVALAQQIFDKGLVFNQLTRESLKAKINSFPRFSTLMKPTASQLAKQNRSHQVAYSRLQKVVADKNKDKGLNTFCGVEIQAAKRQKLEKGHLNKVADTRQQTNLMHKAPNGDILVQKTPVNAPQRTIVPREPDLETTQRADRMRPKADNKVEKVTSNICKFKALPLNGKILESPSLLPPKRTTPKLPQFQEFHLKTEERAKHHIFSPFPCSNFNKVLGKRSVCSNTECQNMGPRRANFRGLPKLDVGEVSSFRALPLNKKIFSSKGDIGVFRNNKKNITVPMEFNFHTGKRAAEQLPIELFNKLSLTSQAKSNQESSMQLPPCCKASKGSKENRFGPFKQECELIKGKQLMPGMRHTQFGGKRATVDVGPLSGNNWNLGIRCDFR